MRSTTSMDELAVLQAKGELLQALCEAICSYRGETPRAFLYRLQGLASLANLPPDTFVAEVRRAQHRAELAAIPSSSSRRAAEADAFEA